jgi:hypothetical protein
VSIKPRRVDFDLFHQSAEAENCYGPFEKRDLSDAAATFGWAGPNRLIWEGYLNVSPILEDESVTIKDLVMRVDFYVGERDAFGVGFSDNAIFRKQYFLRAILDPKLEFYRHTDEEFAREGFQASADDLMRQVDDGWEFDVAGTGFRGTFRIQLDVVPEVGTPQRMPCESDFFATAPAPVAATRPDSA